MPRKASNKKTRRGGFYEFKGGIAPGAPSWGRGSEMGSFNADQINSGAQYGRGRKHKKSRKHTRRNKRKMKGGNKYGAVSASYVGTGSRGMMDVVGTNTKYPPFGGAAQGAFNNAGAQPGSGFKSFDILPK
jgi:hypothetical protein